MPPTSSLRLRLAAAIGLLGLLVALGLSQVISHHSRAQIETDQRALLTNVAQNMSSRLAQDLDVRGEQVQFIASLELMRDPRVPPAAKQAALDAVQARFPHYTWIGLTDAEGRIVAATGSLLVGRSAAQRAWFSEGLKGLHFGDAHEPALLARLLPPPAPGEQPIRLIDIAAPVRGAAGEPVGVVAAHLNLEWAAAARRHLLDRMSVDGIEVTVVDRLDKPLIGSPLVPGGVMAPTPGVLPGREPGATTTAVQTWVDGARYLSATVRDAGFGAYRGLGWSVVARRAEATAFAPAVRLTWLIFGCGVLASLIFALLLWRILGRALAPLEAISGAARRIRAGDLGTAIPVPAGGGEVAVFARSLTELVRELQASNAALALTNRVFEESSQAIAICDARGVILRVNPAFSTVTGHAASQATGRAAAELVSGELPAEKREAVWRQVRAGRRWHGEFENLRRDGERFVQSTTLHALRAAGGEVVHLIVLLDDVTDRRRSAQELERHRHHLEDMLGDRTAELRQANEALRTAREAAERASQAKSDFLANMSHEIRTPLNAIVGLTHLLERQVGQGRASEQLRGIHGAARHLLGIVNDVLDLSKIEAGMLQLECAEVDVEAVVDGVCDLLAERAHDKGLELLIDVGEVPPRVRGDGLRLGQVLLNFASNAVKFTEHGSVVLRVRPLPAPAPADGAPVWLRFEVSDTGIGLSEQARARLFQPFEQADASTTRLYGGTGLGLAISRRLVQLMEGRLGADSVPGRGSTFWAELPFQPVAGVAAPAWPWAGAGRCALVVDAAPAARDLLPQLLTRLGVAATAVADADTALSLLGPGADPAVPCDLVLVDGAQAAGLARGLTSADGRPAPALVWLGAGGLLSEGAPPPGFKARLNKPVTAGRLAAMLQQVFSARPPSPAAARSEPAEQVLRRRTGLRVLLAEDNPVNQEVTVGLLAEVGVAVDVADNGRIAVDLAARRRYDLILMDMQMPVMDGMDAARAIRAASTGARVPMLAMTANAFDESREQCLEAGMDGHVAKPVEPEALYRAMLRWLPPPAGAAAPAPAAIGDSIGVTS